MKKILVVDDEKDIITYLETLYKDNGYATVAASKGDEAIEKAKKEKPDLISLDINLPDQSGMKVYRAIKDDEVLKKIPVVMVTAVTGFGYNPDDIKRFMASRKAFPPPEGFMPKPIDKEGLIKIIKGLIG